MLAYKWVPYLDRAHCCLPKLRGTQTSLNLSLSVPVAILLLVQMPAPGQSCLWSGRTVVTMGESQKVVAALRQVLKEVLGSSPQVWM